MSFFRKIMIGLLLGTGVARADLYDVTLPITAEADSPQEARAAAIQDGEVLAFAQLLERMVDSDHRAQITMPESNAIIDMVQNVSLGHEKNTNTKYMASLSVRFQPHKIQDFLMAQRVPFLTEEMPKAVILPVWEQNGTTAILDDTNPFYAYLKSTEAPTPNIIVPAGDLEEMELARRFVDTQDETAAQHLRDIYQADQIWLVRMTANACGGWIDIIETNPPTDYPETAQNQVAQHGACDGLNIWIPNLWAQALQARENNWRLIKTNDLAVPDAYWVQVPIKRLTDWVALQKKLEKADFLNGIDIVGFRPNEVFIRLNYKGSFYQLQDQLNVAGFNLTVGEMDSVWILTQQGETS